MRPVLCAVALLLVLSAALSAAPAPATAPAFDPQAATAAYLAKVPADVRARSDAYFEGGYWLLLWDFLYGLGVAALLLGTGLSARLRDFTQRLTRFRPVQTFLYAAVYFLLLTVLTLPLTLYESFFRERAYGLLNQSFGAWARDQLVATALTVVLGGLAMTGLYAVFRRAPRTWWLWGAVVALLFLVVGVVLAPIFIEPLFNKYRPAPPGPVRDAIVAMAKANGVPSDKILIYDGSKQSNRYTANVAGLFGTARVAMSDVMFKKGADIAEVRGVVGHEMGHYAHQHSLWITGIFAVLAVVAFFIADRVFPWFAAALDAKGVTGIADPAGLPVLAVILAVLGLLGGPITNTLIREVESDADRYSLVHFNEPDGLAKALVKTIEYRAATPSKLEEVLFYDHPAVSVRVRRAMDWKETHPK